MYILPIRTKSLQSLDVLLSPACDFVSGRNRASLQISWRSIHCLVLRCVNSVWFISFGKYHKEKGSKVYCALYWRAGLHYPYILYIIQIFVMYSRKLALLMWTLKKNKDNILLSWTKIKLARHILMYILNTEFNQDPLGTTEERDANGRIDTSLPCQLREISL